MNKQYYIQKLSYIDEYLLACGWVRSTDGSFGIPDAIINETGAEYNRGCTFEKSVAIAIQTKYDEACMAIAERNNNGTD